MGQLMCKNKKYKKQNLYGKNFLNWIRGISKRFKIPLFLLVLVIVILGMGFLLSSLLSPS
jgi:hypothetical protein